MKNSFFIFTFLFSLLLITNFCNAQNDPVIKATTTPTYSASSYELINPIGNISEVKDQDAGGLSNFFNLLIKIAIALAGAIAVVMIIVGGIQYMGTDSVWEKGESVSRMTGAVGGIVLLLCSYLILYTINPDLVNIKIGIKRVMEEEWSSTENINYDSTPTSAAVNCTGGLIKIPTSINRTGNVDDSICKEFADKLILLKSKTNIDWVITSTTNGTHASLCHKKNTAKTGSCADIALRKNGAPVGADDHDWGIICEAIHSIPEIDFLSEASKTPKCQNIHPNVSTKYGTGPHLHVIYKGK